MDQAIAAIAASVPLVNVAARAPVVLATRTALPP
jgi:hypothetical protein